MAQIHAIARLVKGMLINIFISPISICRIIIHWRDKHTHQIKYTICACLNTMPMQISPVEDLWHPIIDSYKQSYLHSGKNILSFQIHKAFLLMKMINNHPCLLIDQHATFASLFQLPSCIVLAYFFP